MSFYTSENIWFYATLVLAGVLIFQLGMWYGSPGRPPVRKKNSTQKEKQAVAEAETTRRAEGGGCGSTDARAENKKTFPEVAGWTKKLPATSSKKLLGEKDAPLTLVGYFDYQCPFTGRFYTRTLPKLRKKYIEPGKLNFRVKHRPLSMHPKAPAVANAAECGADQGKFWQFTDLYLRGDVGGGQSALLKAGKKLELSDYGGYKECVKNHSHMGRVKKENKQAKTKGIRGTPHFRLEGEKISGARPFTDFKEVIEEKLSE